MNRGSKNLFAFALVVFFSLGVLCATLAAPGQSLASVTGCSQSNRAMEMTECEHPSYLCGFDASSDLFSQGALSSARPNELSKDGLAFAVGEASIDPSATGPFLAGKDCENGFPVKPHKVSIRLFNSTLNL